MNIKHILLAASLVALPASAALAQTNGYERHHINSRKENQQDRIAQGVRSGELRPGEAARLERQERGMRAQDNGHLPARDRHTLARQQNQESRRIYNQKHDSQRYPR